MTASSKRSVRLSLDNSQQLLRSAINQVLSALSTLFKHLKVPILFHPRLEEKLRRTCILKLLCSPRLNIFEQLKKRMNLIITAPFIAAHKLYNYLNGAVGGLGEVYFEAYQVHLQNYKIMRLEWRKYCNNYNNLILCFNNRRRTPNED